MSDVIASIKVALDKLAANKTKAEVIKVEYKEKAKVKALTTAERLDRIEKIMGIQ